jgi:glycerol-3-phosphate O-acyltransferase
MLRCFDPDGDRDLVFIPVGINYDRVLEDRSLLLYLEDDRPRPSLLRSVAVTTGFAFRNFGQMLIRRWHRFGYVCANFGTPISMRRYCREHEVRPCELDRDHRFAFVGQVAGELMSSLGAVIPVVPVSIVATVFQTSPEPLTEFELKAEAHRLTEELEAAGAPIYIPRRDREYAIQVGLRMLTLRHIVEERDGLLTAVPAERPLLEYYANSISHFLPAG